MSGYVNRLIRSGALLNLLYVPALILFIVFIFYPFLKGVQISFTNWDGYNQNYKWIGLKNYARMFSDPDMKIVVKNTIIYGLGSSLFQNFIGLLYALFLNTSIRTRGVVRTIIYLPVIISSLIMGYIWYFFFQYQGGAINDILLLFQDQPANLVEQVIRYVDKHYTEDISIGQIASSLNVSAAYLSSSFHKKKGIPYVKYLTRKRMYKAKELLLETNLQVKQIAERVGYYSTRHFTKLFTEAFGSYPSDYRKMKQSNAE